MGGTPRLLTMRPSAVSIAEVLRIAALPFAIAGIGVGLCFIAAGESLGFYLGPAMVMTLILPVMVAARVRLRDSMIVAGAMIDAVGIVWLIAVFGPNLTFVQWLACYLVLAAYAFALAALARATAAWIATLLGIAWLTWPVWTSPFLNITLARWGTPAHPMLTINAVLLDHGVWLEQPLMYRYSVLGQDVPYALPQSIWPCVVMHALIGLLLLGRGWWRARARSRMREAAAASTAAPRPRPM
jgi:hypothetical protein